MRRVQALPGEQAQFGFSDVQSTAIIMGHRWQVT